MKLETGNLKGVSLFVLVLVSFLSVSFTFPSFAGVSARRDGDVVRVEIDGELFTEYHYKDAARPYFYPLVAPTGDNITRHWPMRDVNKDEQHDHPHHRSLWFTHGDANGHDFWSEGKGPTIALTRLDVSEDGNAVVVITEDEWRTADGKVVCTDKRKHTIRAGEGVRMIDFEVVIIASHGDLVLGDTKEGTMAFRVAPELRLRGNVAKGNIINSEGISGKAAWGKRAKWCDYYGPLNGKTVGIAILDHPENPRHPTWWHARDYGLCTANPFGISYFEKKTKHTGDFRIKAGGTVVFRYRIVLHEGTPFEVDLVRRYEEYAKE